MREEMKVLNVEMYERSVSGISIFSGEMVEIIGEQTVEYEGRILDQYLYNIIGHNPTNGQPFVSLKVNIIVR